MFPQTQTVVHDFTKHAPPCSLWISLPVISCNNSSLSLPFISARLMSTDFVTTPLYHMGSAFSEWPCTELLPRWLISPYVCFTLPHVCFMHRMVILVLLFFYLTSLVPLVTYLFHLLLFKCQVLVCLSQFEISTQLILSCPISSLLELQFFFLSLLCKSRTHRWWAAQYICWGLVLICYCTILDLVDFYPHFYSASSLLMSILELCYH